MNALRNIIVDDPVAISKLTLLVDDLVLEPASNHRIKVMVSPPNCQYEEATLQALQIYHGRGGNDLVGVLHARGLHVLAGKVQQHLHTEEQEIFGRASFASRPLLTGLAAHENIKAQTAQKLHQPRINQDDQGLAKARETWTMQNHKLGIECPYLDSYIKEKLNSLEYSNQEVTYRDIMTTLELCPILRPGIGLLNYSFEGIVQQLELERGQLELGGTIVINACDGQTYHIAMRFRLPWEYPIQPPVVYVDDWKTGRASTVKDHRPTIQRSQPLRLSYLNEWADNGGGEDCDLSTLVAIVKTHLKACPPARDRTNEVQQYPSSPRFETTSTSSPGPAAPFPSPYPSTRVTRMHRATPPHSTGSFANPLRSLVDDGMCPRPSAHASHATGTSGPSSYLQDGAYLVRSGFCPRHPSVALGKAGGSSFCPQCGYFQIPHNPNPGYIHPYSQGRPY